MTDAQVAADADGRADEAWNDSSLISGRSCRDAVGRVCQWHKDRGDKNLVCTPIRKTAPPG